MIEYKLYPNLPPLTPPEALGPRSVENPQVAYHLSVIRAKMQGLKNKEQTFKQKYAVIVNSGHSAEAPCSSETPVQLRPLVHLGPLTPLFSWDPSFI